MGMGVRCLSTRNRGQDSRQQSPDRPIEEGRHLLRSGGEPFIGAGFPAACGDDVLRVGVSGVRLHSTLLRGRGEKSTARTGVSCGGMEIPAYLCD